MKQRAIEAATLTDLSTYLASPIGRACASSRALCWFQGRGLRVIAAWGRLDEDDSRFIVAAMRHEVGPDCGRYASLVDLRGLVHVAPEAYELLLDFIGAHRAIFAARVHHSALLHTGGTAAALAAGYTRLIGQPFASSLHADPREALAAIGVKRPAPLLARLDLLTAAAKAREGGLGRVVEYARSNLQGASLGGCARTLGISERTLQRELRDHATSFREELGKARVDRAATLLVESDEKLLSIALAVGYPKPQNLAAAFNKRKGMTPGAWRTRGRKPTRSE